MSVPPAVPVKHSMFVTVVAWMFIGLAAFAAPGLLLESLLLPHVLLPMLHQQLAAMPIPAGLSPMAGWLFDHAAILCDGLLLIALLHLIAAIGLLRRIDWARRLFLVMLGFDVLYQFAMAAVQWRVIVPMQHAMLQMQLGAGSQPVFPGHLTPQMQAARAAELAQMMPMMDSIMAVTRVFGVISAVVFIILLGWAFWRLRSAAVRREFTLPSARA